MYEPPPGHETVLKTRRRADCRESRLVLEAAGISAQTVHRNGWWFVVVREADLENSAGELEAYRREQAEQVIEHQARTPLYEGAGLAAMAYAATIILVDILAGGFAFDQNWMAAGQMRAGLVQAGEWWRLVTALTLHADAGHLASNLVFGIVFGFLAGRVLGGGVGWLAIVIAGALGNFMNAMVQPPTHTSIGASTAVFAALGILVAHALRPFAVTGEKALKRWSPLIGGVLLLAFLGVGGERTDVLAHLTGFLAGLLIGWVGCRLPREWLSSGTVQKGTGSAAFAVVAVAWVVAFARQ
jgi:membrane associated rhomboid family serine protease